MPCTLIYCKFRVAHTIIIEDIDNIIKGALEVFLSVKKTMRLNLTEKFVTLIETVFVCVFQLVS